MVSEKFNIPSNELVTVVKMVLDELNISVVEELNDNSIVGKTKSSLLSWGETISIKFKSTNSSSIRIEISSKSNAQLIDWGTNAKNENDIMNLIKSNIR